MKEWQKITADDAKEIRSFDRTLISFFFLSSLAGMILAYTIRSNELFTLMAFYLCIVMYYVARQIDALRNALGLNQ